MTPTSHEYPAHGLKERSTVLLMLLALLGTLIVTVAPLPVEAATEPTPIGPQDGACTTFYFNYVPDPHEAQPKTGTAVDYYRFCKEPATGAGPGEAARSDIPSLEALSLHISCSDPFDVPVYDPVGSGDPDDLVGFTSGKGSDLDGWLIKPRDQDGTPVADFAILRKVGSSGFRDCGNFPLPPEDPDTAAVSVVKTVDGDPLGQDDPTFTFTLFADDDGSWVQGATLDTSGDMEWDDLLLGSYLLCETDVPSGYTTEWPADLTTVTHEGDSCVTFVLDEDGQSLVVDVDNVTDVDPEPGAITATKELAEGSDWPEDGTFTFVLYDSEGQIDSGDATDADRTVTFDPLDAGTYTVCEEGLDENWELIGVTVDDVTVDDEDGCVEVTVGEGGTVAVAFTNEFDEPVVPVGIIIELVKTNDADGDGTFTDAETAPEEGADVDFHLLIMNTNGTDVVVNGLTDSYGDITIDLLAGTVAPEGAATLADNTCAALDGVVLLAGESTSCTFTLEGYAPPAGESITNTAGVDVHEDGDPTNTASDTDTSTVDTTVPVVVETNPDISLVKEADVTEAEVGDVITYTYTVTNTGDVTLTDITLDDDVLGEIELESTTLEPGESTTGTATHTVTEADLEAGEVVNVAIVTGWPPEGDAVTDTDDETVNVFEQAVEPRVLEPAPAEETLPKTGAGLLALLVWALTALGLGAGTLRTVPQDHRTTT